MKVRVTILTENDKPRKPGHSEETVAMVWQFALDLLNAASGANEKATVEKVEFVEEGEA